MKKNKKLFAILTLVAFMMSLVPALAFAGDTPTEGTAGAVTTITVNADGTLKLTSDDTIYEVAKDTTTDTTAVVVAKVANPEKVTAVEDTLYATATEDKLVAGDTIAEANFVEVDATVMAKVNQAIKDAKDAVAAVIETSTVSVSDSEATAGDDVTVYIQLKDAKGKATTELNGKYLAVWAERTAGKASAIDFVVGTDGKATNDNGKIYTTNPSSNKLEVKFTTAQAGNVTYRAALLDADEDMDIADAATAANDGKLWLKAADNTTKYEADAISKKEWKIALSGEGLTKTDADKNEYTLSDTALTANGLDPVEITVELTANDNSLSGEKVEISANKAGLEFNKTEFNTNSIGQGKFKVSATKTGEYKIYVDAGTQRATIKVTVGENGFGEIKLLSQMEKAYATDEEMTLAYQVYDLNGNIVDMADANIAKFDSKLLSKPEKSKLKEDHPVTFSNNDDQLLAKITPDAVGEYTLKVFNTDNGKYATVTFTAAEQGKITNMSIEYKAPSVELGYQTSTAKVKLYDADGVSSETTKNVEFAAQGKGFDGWVDGKFGMFKVKDDDKYAGQVITVTAVDTKYNVSAQTTVTIANEANSVAFSKANAAVNEGATLTFSIVDENQNVVAVGTNGKTPEVTVTVTGAPDGAKASADVTKNELTTKGTGKIEVTSNKEGEVTVQVMVKAYQDDTHYKYYTGSTIVDFGKTIADATSTATLIIGSNAFVANGKVATSEVAPFIQNGRTFLPVRALAEALGASVEFDATTNVVTIKGDGVTAVMTLGSTVMTVNDEVVTMDTAAYATAEGRTVVPVRFAAQALGYDLDITANADGTTATVTLSK